MNSLPKISNDFTAKTRRRNPLSLAVSLILIFLLPGVHSNAQLPATPRIPVVDDYFGMKVTDYYRWMENTNDSSVQNWYRQQDAYTENVFTQLPGRDKLLADFNGLDTLASDLSLGFRKDGNDYYFLKRFIKEQRTCLIKKTGDSGKDEVVIDFRKEFPGKDYQFFPLEYSPVSKYFAFFIKEEAHEGRTIYFYDLAHKRFFPEQVRYSFGGMPYQTKFTKDGKGFLYYTLTVANNIATTKGSKAMLHIIGSPPGTDKVLASRDDNPEFADWNENSEFEVVTDPQYNYLLLTALNQKGEYLFIAPYNELAKEKINWKVLARPEDKLFTPIIRNGVAYFQSTVPANGKLVKCSLGDLQNLGFETLVDEQKDKLSGFSATSDYLILRYTNGVSTWLNQYNLKTGKVQKVPLAQKGIVRMERLSEKGQEILLTASDWNSPLQTYIYDPENRMLRKFAIKTEITYPEVNNLVVREIEVKGYDGTLIPLSLVYDKHTKLDGNAVLQLSGYGAYGNVKSPSLSEDYIVLGKRGVIFAYAHVRGGGEKGEPWRLAGYKSTKANTWKDFISCAEWLIDNHYTSSSHLVIESASAGGIMVGRAMTERPDLFAVVIDRVGLNNVLRHEQFSKGNIPEFGTVADSAQSRYLYDMDVVQHVKKNVAYPAVLCTVGMADGRLAPWEAGKLVAALQHASSSRKPVLLQVYFQGDHFGESGAASNLNRANEWAFVLWQAGHPNFQLTK